MKRKIIFLLCAFCFLVGKVNAQNTTLQGAVKDTQGEAVIGASVLLKGTSIGTITGLDGDFKLDNVPAGSNVIVVSYVGYTTQEISVNGRKNIEVTLAEDAELLDEVVVVGYGVQRKTDVTSAVASVKKRTSPRW